MKSELLQFPLFQHLARDEHCPEFLEKGEIILCSSGERLVEEGTPAAFYVVLEGALQVLKKTNESEILLATHSPGSFFGELPLLLGTGFVASGKAEGDAKVWKIGEEVFWEMLAACPTVARQIMGTMATRVRNLETINQSHERLISLGTMAAGLTHELNNPAAGARHAARELRELSTRLPALTCAVNKAVRAQDVHDWLAEAGRRVREGVGNDQKLSALERADRESQIADWLYERDFEDADDLAATFLASGLDETWMEEVESVVGAAALEPVLRWLGAQAVIEDATRNVDEATRRISDIVARVKRFSHLDESPVGEVDVRAGLENTLKMLAHKLRSISVTTEWAPQIPLIWGQAGELDQVWTNLLDNAADALANVEDPRIIVRTRCEGDALRVEIEDNGPGIAEESKTRLFEPFYTTKAAGQGTGLGLAISHRIVNGQHRGDLRVESEPGRTVFRVTLPVRE